MSQELLMAASALMGLLVIAGATLKGWQDWLALKSRELETGRRPHEIEGGSREGAAHSLRRHRVVSLPANGLEPLDDPRRLDVRARVAQDRRKAGLPAGLQTTLKIPCIRGLFLSAGRGE